MTLGERWRVFACCRLYAWHCRVPPRQAGNFHLLAQMKVTKAKGLTLFGQLAFGYAHLADRSERPRPTNHGFVGALARPSRQRPVADAELLKCVLRPFALVTFIWASK
jgi:hypothetical protein